MWPLAPSRTSPAAEPDLPETRHAAVIDIGSNSIRLVVYRLEGRAIWTVYNEKAVASLGRDLPAPAPPWRGFLLEPGRAGAGFGRAHERLVIAYQGLALDAWA